ncbi:MAG TPA: PilX N-terminal domain-containing pilus assembly protein [Burkholderiales bacterium]|nr:PilX N-terminal domain-containing pilus assembly protein [Burkholderiales bacterium]
MRSLSSQRGATLLVALVILVLLALLSLSAFQTSMTDQKASGNMQARTEALNAAQETIETVISTRQFVVDPSNAIAKPCEGPNTYCSDLNGDGAPEYKTRLLPAPACVTTKVLKVSDLDLNSSEDLSCSVGQSQQFGVAGADTAASDSLCANTMWEVTAETTAVGGGAKVTVSQGIGLRVGADEASGSCL